MQGLICEILQQQQRSLSPKIIMLLAATLPAQLAVHGLCNVLPRYWNWLTCTVPFSGHLGKTKTTRRILPTLYNDVAEFCRACRSCQKTTPLGTRRAPLIPLPVMGETLPANSHSFYEELVHLFSRVGVPKEILADQGCNFTSQLLTEVYKMLHVHPIRTTPYQILRPMGILIRL